MTAIKAMSMRRLMAGSRDHRNRADGSVAPTPALLSLFFAYCPRQALAAIAGCGLDQRYLIDLALADFDAFVGQPFARREHVAFETADELVVIVARDRTRTRLNSSH